ncbi:hypothetical protein C8Q75DRAFT_810416 [Abortiporus biennis]|nr:hypothetical protein C8Q75DRAFT_810416 [Abortiporus biennis]
MESFSWSDSVHAVFGPCLPCLRRSESHSDEESQQQGLSSHNIHPHHAGVPRARPDELEGLLAETDDAETMSLHSNIGDRDRRRKKKKNRRRKGIRLFGFDLFGRQPIYLSDDEENDHPRRAGDRARTISTSTLDSDAAPLDPSTIDELSAERMAASIAAQKAAQEEERRAKEERRRKRRERRESKKALELALQREGEFEGFQGSGSGFSSPFHNSNGPGSDSTSSPMPQEDFGPFASAQQHVDMLSNLLNDEADIEGADFGAETYAKRVTNGNSTGTGSDSRSRTSASNSNADSSRYNHHFISQQQLYDRRMTMDGSPLISHSPTTPTSSASVDVEGEQLPPIVKKKKKPRKSARHSISTASQSMSIPSPPPQQANFPAAIIASPEQCQHPVIDPFPSGGFDKSDGFPSVGLVAPGRMSRKNSEAGVFLARRGDE